MFEMSFEINGKKVAPGNIGSEIQKAVERAAHEKIMHTVQGVRCPVHGQFAKIEPNGSDFKVSGCCEALIEQVKKSLK